MWTNTFICERARILLNQSFEGETLSSRGILPPFSRALRRKGSASSGPRQDPIHEAIYYTLSSHLPQEQQWPFSAAAGSGGMLLRALLGGDEWGQPGAGRTIAGWAPCPSDPSREAGNPQSSERLKASYPNKAALSLEEIPSVQT